MAVPEGQDRRVGLGPEKLLTLEEAAKRLGVSVEEVRRRIREGKLAVFRLGGDLLRVRSGDVEALRTRGGSPPSAVHPHSPFDRLRDFFYFNDFYLAALLVLAVLLLLIFRLT